MAELKDTVGLMTSENYKERFVAEYLQTKIRYKKLRKFCNKITASQITETDEPNHDCPLFLLEKQLSAMAEYLNLLELRAIVEQIDLENTPI